MAHDTLTIPAPAPEARTARPHHRWRAAWSRLRSSARAQDLLTVLPLLLVTAVVHGTNVAGWPAFFDDEGTYLSQAYATYEGQLAPYTYWYDHPPVGWMQLAAVAWLPGLFATPELVAGRLSMIVFSLSASVLVYALARRLRLRRGFAVAAVLLWALSPLTVFESRQVFLDAIAVPWLLGALFLALSPRRHLGHYMAAGFCLGVAVLTKETTVVFAPAVLLALLQSSHHRTRAFALVSFGTSFVITGLSYILFALLKGELFPGGGHVSLLDALIFQVADRRGSGFILQPGSGAYGLLQFWLDFDRVLIVGGVGAAMLALGVRRLRPVSVAVLVSALVALRPNGYMPYMYVTAALPFAALAIAGVTDQAWSLLGRGWRGAHRARARSADWTVVVPRAALAIAMAAGVWTFAPGWVQRNQVALTADLNASHADAVAWMTANVDPDSVVVTDNNYWLDLAAAGWEPGWGVVWFWKLDLDPITSRRELPGGWRDVDYVIWSGAFKSLEDNRLPIVEQIYQNSEVVAAFGTTDADKVEIRRVIE